MDEVPSPHTLTPRTWFSESRMSSFLGFEKAFFQCNKVSPDHRMSLKLILHRSMGFCIAILVRMRYPILHISFN